ncbi:MAG: hypothetical protein ACRDJP_03340, partial [Actinomycetota bacterium]
MTPSSFNGWAAALDTLEERLRRQEAVAAMATDELPDDVLPEVDGPLPPALRPRAVALLERTRRLEEQVEARLAAGAPRQHSYA